MFQILCKSPWLHFILTTLSLWGYFILFVLKMGHKRALQGSLTNRSLMTKKRKSWASAPAGAPCMPLLVPLFTCGLCLETIWVTQSLWNFLPCGALRAYGLYNHAGLQCLYLAVCSCGNCAPKSIRSLLDPYLEYLKSSVEHASPRRQSQSLILKYGFWRNKS